VPFLHAFKEYVNFVQTTDFLFLGQTRKSHDYYGNSNNYYGSNYNSYGQKDYQRDKWSGLSDLILLSVAGLIIYALYRTCLASPGSRTYGDREYRYVFSSLPIKSFLENVLIHHICALAPPMTIMGILAEITLAAVGGPPPALEVLAIAVAVAMEAAAAASMTMPTVTSQEVTEATAAEAAGASGQEWLLVVSWDTCLETEGKSRI